MFRNPSNKRNSPAATLWSTVDDRVSEPILASYAKNSTQLTKSPSHKFAACTVLQQGDYQNNDYALFTNKSFQKIAKLSKKVRSFATDKIKLNVA